MPLTEATVNWQSVTLNRDETWFPVGGTLRIFARAGIVPDAANGAQLVVGSSMSFVAGQTIHYRRGRGSDSEQCTFERVETSL